MSREREGAKQEGTNREGLFITFEGGEGAGKSTLINKIYDELIKQGHSTVKTREPGGTKLGEQIRQVILSHDTAAPIGTRAELLLFLASRVQSLDEVILPALKAGKVVLCDRYNDSSSAYQGHARGLGIDRVEALANLACEGLTPDVTFFLDLDPDVGLKRTRNASRESPADRIEQEKLAFHNQVRKGFLELAERHSERFVVINAEHSPDEVFQAAWSTLTKHFSRI